MAFKSLVDLLHDHAGRRAAKPAFIFLDEEGNTRDVLSFAALLEQAQAVSAALRDHAVEPGDRVLLAFAPGLAFLTGFFGCLMAGAVAVPLPPPRRGGRDTTAGIIADCRPRLGLTSAARRPGSALVDWLSLPLATSRVVPPARVMPESLAFLQYTSGSTATPKGVLVSHANLWSNLEMIRQAYRHTDRSTHASWLPLHHDMGLILNALAAFHVGATCVLLAPTSFLQRPLAWLKAIDHFGARVAGGPNFGFDLCVARFRAEAMSGLDLSHWKVAINGAEPVRASTLEKFSATFAPWGFRRSAFRPSYGMAEATVLVSAGGYSGEPVHCGPPLPGEELAIVDPVTCTRVAAGATGEIWIRGPNVARGYWDNEEATRAVFSAVLREESGSWLRSGDLGHLNAGGELVVTGRLKELIIVRGTNHYPQDIEYTVQTADPALRPGFGAAFAVSDAAGLERVVVVQEVARDRRHALDIEELIGNIREAVADTHGLGLHDIALVRPGTIVKTTSGKVQRGLMRSMWLEGKLAGRLIHSAQYSDARTAPT